MKISCVYKNKTSELIGCEIPAFQRAGAITCLISGVIGILIAIAAILQGAPHGGGVALYALLSLPFIGIGILLNILQMRAIHLYRRPMRALACFALFPSLVFLLESLYIISINIFAK